MKSVLLLILIPLSMAVSEIDRVTVSDISDEEFDRYFERLLKRASESELDSVEDLQKAVVLCDREKEKDKISCIVPKYAEIVLKYNLSPEFKKTVIQAIKRKQVFKLDGSKRVDKVDLLD
ncbi:hypothetical protein PFISCL1PPCAC_15098 [Pristionchus fissidentatus]|uniref:Uncharacterized protein n=1 Tax=Pristionchus fissidentatus TaxID=1538716 RepID=A0AAV5VW98_9BILA|nr:hypothetical protein PFISCL1PPCAC_15098 [Pristionchus fissidentatus]